MRSSVTGSAPVGKYALEVGAHTGSFAHFASTSSGAAKAQARKNAAALRAALTEPDERPQSHTPLEAVEEFEQSADAVTDRVEHASKLFKAAFQDRLFDRTLLTGEIGALLGLLDRLDREGRYEEEIRVAKALHGLCVLAFRWLDLVRSLRSALAAARAAGDETGQAWALNELGALHLCAGDPKKAKECLERALELQEALGDAAGRCATRHNCDSARRDIARPIQVGPPRRLRTPGGAVRPLLIATVAAVAALVAVGGVAIAPIVANGGGKGAAAAVDVVSDAGAGELVATIGERPPKLSATAAASFSFSAEGAEGFECKRDDQVFKSCRSPVHYRDVKEGEHSFQVRATAKGEQGPAAQYVWRIDLTAPTTTITAKPSGHTTTASAAFRFEANEEVKTFQCKLDEDPFTTCTSPENLPGPLDEGRHIFAVRAIDLSGNVGAAERYQWKILTNRKTSVPDIVGMQLTRGIDALKGAQLKWETEETASAQPVGEIVGQTPTAGEEVPLDTLVTVMVSAGIEITVPSLFGLAEDSALTELKQKGLQAHAVRARSNRVSEGHVFAQNPDPGTPIARGATVQISVSSGSPLPDLTVTIADNGVQVSCPAGVGSCVTKVTFTLTNEGEGDIRENFEVLVAAGPRARGTVTVRGGLAAGASTVLSKRLGGSCFSADCVVQVTVDPAGNILELDEQNNVAEWGRLG